MLARQSVTVRFSCCLRLIVHPPLFVGDIWAELVLLISIDLVIVSPVVMNCEPPQSELCCGQVHLTLCVCVCVARCPWRVLMRVCFLCL